MRETLEQFSKKYLELAGHSGTLPSAASAAPQADQQVDAPGDAHPFDLKAFQIDWEERLRQVA